MTGAMTCSTVVPIATFVRRPASLNSRILAHLLWQSAVPSGVPVWSTPKTNSVFGTCNNEALLSPVGVEALTRIVEFILPWSSSCMLGFCGYVESAAGRKWRLLTEVFRLAPARRSAHATASVEVPLAIMAIAVCLCFANLVCSRRSAVKSSWRRTASKGFLKTGKCL